MVKIDLNNWISFDDQNLNYFKFDFDIEMATFNVYINENDNLINTIQKNLEKRINDDENLKDPKWEDLHSYYSHFYEFEERVNSLLTKTHRFSAFLSIMAFFESKLKELCLILQDLKKPIISLSDIQGNDYLGAYWTYLKKVLVLDLDNVEPKFTPIKQLQPLRNTVAHSDGNIGSEKLKKIILDSKELDLFEDGSRLVISSDEFLKSLLKNVDEFFDSLLLSVSNNLKSN